MQVSNVVLIMELARPIYGNFFFSYDETHEAKTAEQVHLPSNGKATYRFRRAFSKAELQLFIDIIAAN